MISRNAASSRAIPVETCIQQVVDDPVIPVEWGKNRKGMVATTVLDEQDEKRARELWLHARDRAVESARWLAATGLHKQLANRIIEPWR